MTLSSNLVEALHRVGQIADEGFMLLAGGTLTPRQRAVLVAVARLEDPSQTDLVEATGIDRSTMADLVRRLSARGLIARRKTRKDARRYAVRLTPKGLDAIRDTDHAAEEAAALLIRRMPVTHRKPFLEGLACISKAGSLEMPRAVA
ncbi:MarR family winged helix-turn-helix transcriptional regulator [uncultured Hyphomicrobium sp.]|uniref:MarR family winged helix-turn-helix transcriptional regulator n=1 Tax=uncultured Hyphomicrobium sp. TaxID=194373 RepID=UPI0025DFFC84|nr:MarR family winged helix-turn-helix transcriptional regulator [uncultured Hyphomicrobium sp.]